MGERMFDVVGTMVVTADVMAAARRVTRETIMSAAAMRAAALRLDAARADRVAAVKGVDAARDRFARSTAKLAAARARLR